MLYHQLNEQENPIYHHQQKTMLHLPAQKRVEQLGLRRFDGNEILQIEKKQHHKQVGIPCGMVQNEINSEADESPNDEQAMVNESLFQA